MSTTKVNIFISDTHTGKEQGVVFLQLVWLACVVMDPECSVPFLPLDYNVLGLNICLTIQDSRTTFSDDHTLRFNGKVWKK